MSTYPIYLRLENETLQWRSDEKSEWTDVGPSSPTTGVNEGDEIDWIADENSISKLKIDLPDGKIINKVKNNDGRKPIGDVNRSISKPISEKYTISAKPTKETKSNGGYVTADPVIKYPKD